MIVRQETEFKKRADENFIRQLKNGGLPHSLCHFLRIIDQSLAPAESSVGYRGSSFSLNTIAQGQHIQPALSIKRNILAGKVSSISSHFL